MSFHLIKWVWIIFCRCLVANLANAVNWYIFHSFIMRCQGSMLEANYFLHMYLRREEGVKYNVSC